MNKKDINNVFEWEIEQLNDYEFTLSVDYKAQSKLIRYLFNKSAPLACRRAGVSYNKAAADNFINDLPNNRFNLDKSYYKFIKMILKPVLSDISSQMVKDRILLTDFEVRSGLFDRKTLKDEWVLKICFGGGWRYVE